MPKESKLVESLRKYLNETPPEQLEKELEELEPYNEIGPDCMEYIKFVKGLQKEAHKNEKK